MTSHELARKLLEVEDVPVIRYVDEGIYYEEIVEVSDYQYLSYYSADRSNHIANCVELF